MTMTTATKKTTKRTAAATRFGAEGVYSKREAATHLHCSIRKVEMEIRAGRIHARKLGRRTVVCVAGLKEYLANLPEAGE